MAKSYYLLPKAMHFAIFAASAFFSPYLAVFFRYLGFSTVQIGVLTSLFPFISMLGTMIWPGIADKQRRHRTILLILMACTVFILIFYTIHPLVKNFAMLLILHIILAFFSSPISSIVDSFVLAILGMNNEKELYGQQRLWAAISWGLCSFLSGIIIDHWPIEFIFYAGAFGYVLSFLLILLKLKYNDLNSVIKSDNETMKEMDKDASPKVADDVSSTSEPSTLVDIPIEPNEIIVVPSFWTSFKTLLSLQFVLFNITVMMIGMGAAVIGNFLFVFLRQDLNASGLLLGVDMIFTVLLELPFFFYGKQLLDRVGIRWMMVAAAASLMIRSFGYCIIPTAWWVLPFELFHGLMFASFWTAGVQYASDIAPPGLEATAQGVFNASFSLGQGIGALIGGVVYQASGPYVLFFGTGVLGVVALVFFVVTHRPVDTDKTVHGKHQQIPRNESNVELNTMTGEP